MDSREEYIEAVREYLIEKHGEVKPSWEGLIEMLSYEYELFLTAKNEIYTNGMTVTGARGISPSPFIKIMQDAAIQVQKICNDLGVNPKMVNKVKREEKDDDNNDFISNLIN